MYRLEESRSNVGAATACLPSPCTVWLSMCPVGGKKTDWSSPHVAVPQPTQKPLVEMARDTNPRFFQLLQFSEHGKENAETEVLSREQTGLARWPSIHTGLYDHVEVSSVTLMMAFTSARMCIRGISSLGGIWPGSDDSRFQPCWFVISSRSHPAQHPTWPVCTLRHLVPFCVVHHIRHVIARRGGARL